MLKVVIDTNVIVSALSSRSKYHWVIELILNEQIEMYVTDEIILEYEEILNQKYSHVACTLFINALKELPNVKYIKVYYNWVLLKDLDDNKFVDCYVAASAEYLITNDRGFNILSSINFPKVACVALENFEQLIA